MTGRRTVFMTTLAGVAILALVATLGWLLVLSPRLTAAADVAAEAEAVEFANLQLQTRYRQAVEQARSAPQAAADAQELFATMPQEAELPTVLLQIVDAARAAGIAANQISVINTSVPRPLTGEGARDGEDPSAAGGLARDLGVDLAQLELDVTVTGGRAELLAFLDNLQGLDRAILLTSSGLTDAEQGRGETGTEAAVASSGGGEQSLAVTGSMYVLQSRLPDLVATVEQLIAESGLTVS
jgi:Tfp pilus assembly protein PilO